MIVPIALGAAALYGLWRYSKRTVPVNSIAVSAAAQGAYAAPAPAPSGISYPQATTSMNPSDMHTQGQVIRYQAAQPMPTNKYYRPADGDIASIVSLRFDPDTDGTGHLLPGKDVTRTATWMADLGKLNGFLGLADLGAWIKAKKPLHLPASATDKGSRTGATGTVS